MTCTLNTSETVARSCPLNEYSIDRFANDAYRILKQFNKSSANSNVYSPAIINLGLSAGKFVESLNTKSIADLFSRQATKNETISSATMTTTTTDWPDLDDEEDHQPEDNEEEESEKEENLPSSTAGPLQGDFFRKFQKIEEPLKTPSKSDVRPTGSITSFFSRYKSNENLSNSSPAKSDDCYVMCSKCNKSILSWTMPEHEDFHYARELQMEENRNHSPVMTIAKPSKPLKRKKDTNQTLDAFLSKKSKN